MSKGKIVYYKQLDQMDCGPTCIRIIAKFYGKAFSLQHLRSLSGINREGVSLLGISEAAEKIGFRTRGMKMSLTALSQITLPCILHWNQNHFVVLHKIKGRKFFIADPSKGEVVYDDTEFISHWRTDLAKEQREGIILTLDPGPQFFQYDEETSAELSMQYLFGYLFRYKQLIIQLFIGLAVGSLLQLILPFLTQSIVDIGINTKNLNFIYIILIAQTMLFMGRLSVEFIRSWILLHISTRVNISILTDFIIKLMKLPMSFFDSRMTGDIMQRMNDQSRIQTFLTGPTLNIVFSVFNLVVFAIVLAHYNFVIFFIFLASTIIYSLWVVFFLKKRRSLDYKMFDISAKNQNSIVQLIAGMQEIKLTNSEVHKRWEWERIQASLFKFNVQSLKLGQIQQGGTFFINEGKNILITFIVAKAVVEGQMTLGAMMAVQYIVGQLNSPIEQMLGFIQQFQNAKISMERLNEVQQINDEEPVGKHFNNFLPSDRTIELRNVSFTYPGAGNEPIFSGINLKIPEGKTTAIVGMSGSGKTTIIKLLLRFYRHHTGDLKVGHQNLDEIGFKFWRQQCGTVMQDGFIFSDTIARNIAVGEEFPEADKLEHALQVANIKEFVDALPLGLNTKIGQEGNGISQGQKQRLLIARAVYKDPKYIFFDEATNALDAHNEKIIMENLEQFFKGKTVIVVAHRLSTVKNADNIIVLDKGKIMEQGTHSVLTKARGEYYNLVKNQLELGN